VVEFRIRWSYQPAPRGFAVRFAVYLHASGNVSSPTRVVAIWLVEAREKRFWRANCRRLHVSPLRNSSREDAFSTDQVLRRASQKHLALVSRVKPISNERLVTLFIYVPSRTSFVTRPILTSSDDARYRLVEIELSRRWRYLWSIMNCESSGLFLKLHRKESSLYLFIILFSAAEINASRVTFPNNAPDYLQTW
jgi:hypothetical protein